MDGGLHEGSAFLSSQSLGRLDAVGEVHKRNRFSFAELAADAELCGRKSKVLPVKVVCIGFVGRSLARLLKNLGIQGQVQHQASKSLSGAAEKVSQWF